MTNIGTKLISVIEQTIIIVRIIIIKVYNPGVVEVIHEDKLLCDHDIC